MTERHVVVVGGGIAGLAAAHALTAGEAQPRVTVFEADDRLGGKLRTAPFAGIDAVDEGPDAFLARLPWGTALARAVGLGEQLTSPESGSAWVWWDRMHDIPGGLLLGLPTGVRAMATTRLLGWSGKARAALEPFLPRTSTDHDTLGRWVRDRFGAQVHERLVDPLVGSIYAADTDHFSLAAVPQLAELAGASRSVLLGARRRPAPPPGPVFYAPRRGMADLAAATAAAITAAGGDLRLNTPVTELAADGGRWRVNGVRADAVILACPAPATAALLAGVDRASSAALGSLPGADVALVTLAVAAADLPATCAGRSGYLVPKPKQRLVTAVSFGSNKWAHWNDGRLALLRVSLGRDGLGVLHLSDEALITTCLEELGRHLGINLQPVATRVSRWPRAFPQYRPHHATTVAAIAAGLPGGVHLAGASYHGIGVPACVRSGQQAALAATGRATTT